MAGGVVPFPATGLAEYGGHEFWYVMVGDPDGETWDFSPRIFIMHRLPPEQLAREWQAHRDFAATGTMRACLHSPPCPVDSPGDREALETLWKRWPSERERDYEEAEAVGWFSDTSAATP